MIVQKHGRRIGVRDVDGRIVGGLITHGTGVSSFLPDGRFVGLFDSWLVALNDLIKRRSP